MTSVMLPTDPVLARIREWAARTDAVRVVCLTGSRAVENPRLDRFSDYDVMLFVTDPSALVTDAAWPRVFGRILVDFQDVVKDGDGSYAMHLVLFEDGTKIDFAVAPVDLVRRIVSGQRLPAMLDAGCQILVDKDGLTARLPAPTHCAHMLRQPGQQEFANLVREFWWETTYVAKQLWREDLLPAKHSLDSVVILDLLRRMLEWRLAIDREWRYTPGDLGRGFQAQLDRETWAEFAAGFAGPAMQDNWDALFRATRLFRRTSIDVAARLGLAYPRDLDARVTAYLESVRQAPRKGG
jgi:aminoglycoside 6-adenylyltransferase